MPPYWPVLSLAWGVAAALALRQGRRGMWVLLATIGALALAIAGDATLFGNPSHEVAVAVAAAVAYGSARPAAAPWAALLAAVVVLERSLNSEPLPLLTAALTGWLAGLLAHGLVVRLRTYLPWRAVVVPHTHWDREWYETVAGYRPKLLAAVDGVVAELERQGGVERFTLDGQTIALEDYLGDRPEMRDRVDALVRAGRLLIGPWYVLSDLILVHGESTLRNLEEGLRVAAGHARAMRVGYVADPFGHPAQMPQILRGFGYRSYVFSRGLGDEGEDLGAEFDWQAPSGDRVLAIHLVGHYDNALPLLREVTDVAAPDLRARVRRVLPRVLARATAYAHSDLLLLMVGTDHAPITPELGAGIAAMREARPRLRAGIGTLEDVVERLSALRLPLHAGEMVAGRYRPVLRGVNSTRMWIKQENAAAERLLLRWLEPFGALLGGVRREDVRSLWRALLACHPHDSICGCSIDAVHDVDMRGRFSSVREQGEALRRRLLDGGDGEPLAWSAVPFPTARVVDHGGGSRFVRFAGLGSAPLEGSSPVQLVSSPGEGVLENGRLRVEVAQDGSFFVEGPGGRSGPHNIFLDEGDRGDEYTYSFAGPSVSSAGVDGTRAATCDGLRGEVRVSLQLEVPRSLREDRRARQEERVPLAIDTRVRLEAEASHVEVRTRVENVARDHRLRALFNTGRTAQAHVAGEQFAWLRRSHRPSRRRGWAEQPADSAHLQDFVAVGDGIGGIVVGGDGLPEYAVLASGREIALTLLRAVGFLSRGDLPERPGHAGPALETPGAQVPGWRGARYCLVPISSVDELPSAARSLEAFRVEPVVAGRGTAKTLFSLDGDGAIELSALRPGPHPGTLVLRLVNPDRRAATARLRFGRAVRAAVATDLREGEDDLGATGLPVLRTPAPLDDLGDGTLEAHLAPFEIGTWLFEMTSG